MKKTYIPYLMLPYLWNYISSINKTKVEKQKNSPNWTGLTVLSTETVYMALKLTKPMNI